MWHSFLVRSFLCVLDYYSAVFNCVFWVVVHVVVCCVYVFSIRCAYRSCFISPRSTAHDWTYYINRHVFQLPQFILVAQNHEKIVLQTYWDGRFESTQHCERFLVYIEYNWSSLINPSSFCFLLAEINLMILIICKFVIQ